MAYPGPYEFNFTNNNKSFLDRKVLEGTVALDFPSIAAAASATLTVNVPGAVVGDAVIVSGADAAGPTAGLLFTAWVSAAGVVTVRATNVTAAPVDAAVANFVALIVQKD